MRRWFSEYVKRVRPYILVSGLVLIFIAVMLWPLIFITVNAGEAGVLWLRFFKGTVTDKVYSEGLHVICPWDKMYIYDVRVQTRTETIYVLSKNGLRVGIKYAARYRPEYDLLGVMHAEVGPAYADKIVIPEVEASLRKTAGGCDSEVLYSSQGSIVEKIVNEALDAVAHRYIRMDNVNIREVILPEEIRMAIEAKLVQSELAKSYEYRLLREHKEAERRFVEANGLKVANEIVIPTLTPALLRFKGIEATALLASSTNAKVVVVGSGPDGLPLILGGDR